MNRRGFLQGLMASAVIAYAASTGLVRHAVEVAKQRWHILYGDGKHDDTLAIQAMLDGEDVMRPDGSLKRMENNTVTFGEGTYSVGAPVRVSRSNTVIRAGNFIGEHIGPILEVKPATGQPPLENILIEGNCFNTKNYQTLAEAVKNCWPQEIPAGARVLKTASGTRWWT